MLGRLQEEYARMGLEVVAIDIYGSPAREWVGFWKSNGGGDVTWGAATSGRIVADYGVLVLGQTVVLDRGHGIVYNGGPLGYDRLKRYVEKAL